MKKVLLFAAASLVAFSSCKKDKAEKHEEKIVKGEVKEFQHHGKAWTWYEEDANKNPVRLGVAIDDVAMNSLDRSTGNMPGHNHVNAVSMKVHPKASAATPYQHIMLDWVPVGHIPVFKASHFALHFYMTSEEERKAIPRYDQDSLKFKNYPAPAYMPANYIPVPGGAPQMGTHWVDITAPEFNGGMFTHAIIQGTYNGKNTFLEPLITEKLILDNPTFERALPQPVKYQKAGWYPTKIRIEKKTGVTNIILEGFTQRQAS